ncbi:phage tail tape measure protein [Streptomyces sp. JH14]|uniref:phage tail tape measure protein n=1 Tax=Streptomyces sp. JH14 TaxID=2793630 RepID=UPI0023F913EF|nr:phage tail tape measure protein [Streptomyces sp. JH14]MDF6043257.1 phage tail tape measure protein [Streptomyces sp. JH14]
MVTRTVTVRLRADISNYTRNMRNASDNTSRLANGGAAAGAALLAGFAVAAAAAAKFDKALSNVRAVTGASTADMAKLRAAALDAGKTSVFTATEAANAEAELARAGVSTANIIGGALKGSLALAASGQVDLAEAATLSAQAMNTFGLTGKDVGHIADLLAAGANKSAADVHGLGTALRQGGLLAHQTGLSIEDTVATLSAFADHALIGSDAGTSLKTMLQRLVPQSKEAQAAMEKIGFSAYDSSGQFVGLSETAQRMKESFGKLTPEARNSAMATIFGSDAVRSATILYELGAKGIDAYKRAVDDQGAAQRMASVQTDNLVGDMERLKGAIEVALIEGGSSANGALRTMAQWITTVVDAYNRLPAPLQHAVTLFAGIGGAVTLAGSAMLLLLPRIAATRAALASMGVTAARARTSMMVLGQVGAVVAGLELVSMASQKVRDTFADAPPSTAKMAASLVDLAQKGKAAGELTKTFGDNLDGFGDAVSRIAHPSGENRATDIVNSLTLQMTEGIAETDIALQDARDQVKSIDDALGGLVTSGHADVAAEAFDIMAANAEKNGTSVEKLKTLLPGYTDALANTGIEQQLTGKSQEDLASDLALTTDELQDQRSEAEKLTDTLKALNGINIGAAEQEISFRKSLADLTGAVKDNGHSLDVTSEKGRAVKGAFLEAAKAAMEHAQAVAEQKDSVEAGNEVLVKDVEALKATMHAAGFSKDAIDKLTAAYTQLPPEASTKITADTKAAVKDLQTVQDKIRSTKGKPFTMTAMTKTAEKLLKDLGYTVTHMKDGSVKVSVPTGTPIAQVGAIQRAINGISGKPVGIGVYLKATTSDTDANGVPDMIQARAQGGIVRRAGGGAVRYYPQGGAVFGPGTGTSDSIPALISNGEYVVKASSVQKYGVAMFDRLNAGRFAGGGLAGFTYTPTGTAVLGGPGDAKARYDKELADLKAAWDALTKALADAKKKADALRDAEKNLAKVRKGKHTKHQLEVAEDKVTAARKSKKTADAKVKEERQDVYDADKALGVKRGAKAPTTFNLAAYQKQLTASLAATTKWRNNLAKIGKRGGAEIQALLEAMGEDGYALVNSLAGASDKQFKDIVSKLKATGDTAKATLADFTQQLNAANKVNAQFASDLQTLAAKGYGDLAQALAAQGDANAQALAHAAATGNSADVAKANAAVTTAGQALSGEDLSNALVLLTTLRGGTGRGYADLIAAGLDAGTIRSLVPKMLAQINSLPEANKAAFLKQFAGQTGITAMARGGILGSPTVLAGEAGAEAYIPINGSARSRALLATTARMLGYDARPAGRWGSGPSGAPVTQQVTKHIELHLHGAKQTSGEQAMDVARHMSLIS